MESLDADRASLMIALPKGRLVDQTLQLFAAAGLPLPAADNGRKLILASAVGDIRYVMSLSLIHI